jgi:hypothetical protein
MKKRRSYLERLKRLQEILKDPNALKRLCKEYPGQVLIIGSFGLEILEAEGDLEKVEDLESFYAIGFYLDQANELVNAEILRKTQISKGDKLRLNYLFKRIRSLKLI